jgi:transposase
MTDSHTTPEAAILVAVDIAKDHNEVLIELRERRDRHRRFRVANTLEEYKRLVAYLRQLDAPALIGFEATGNYHRPLAYFLHAQGFELRLIPTMALARTREAMHNSWDKNDPKDAQVILHLLKTGLSQTWYDPLVSGTNDAQALSKTHHQVTLARTRVWHRLRNHYFSLYFPEIEHFIRSDHSDWLIQLLLRPDTRRDHIPRVRGLRRASLEPGRSQGSQVGAARRDLRCRGAFDRASGDARQRCGSVAPSGARGVPGARPHA